VSRQPSAAAERHRRAATRPTTRPGSETTGLAVGDPVRVARSGGSTGTWSRYDGRNGWVAALTTQTFPSGVTYVEIGVSWVQPTDRRNPATDAWFRADELEAVEP
jgi:hypothetical protein